MFLRYVSLNALNNSLKIIVNLEKLKIIQEGFIYKAFIISILDNIWLLLTIENLHNSYFHFMKTWQSCFNNHKTLKHFGPFIMIRSIQFGFSGLLKQVLCDMVKHELRVTSYELRVTSCELRVMSWKLKSTSSNSKVQVQTHQLRVQIHELQVQIHEFKNH